MKKCLRKFGRNLKGFTLVEVMIGMMILVVAIVTATSLLINIMNSNKMIANHLKAYYLAQEGVEAVRNIRDTRWLNNRDWLGGGLYENFEIGGVYSVQLNTDAWGVSEAVDIGQIAEMSQYYQWEFEKKDSDFNYEPEFIVNNLSDGNTYPEFYRYIEFEEYESPACEEDDDDECNGDFILARSVVKWRDLGREYNVTLEEVLSNWKGGAL